MMTIGGGRTEWSRSPLPPNRTGGFPASGSPVGGFTSKRSDERSSVAKEKAPRDRRDNAHPAYRVITMRINPGQRARLRRRRVELSGSLARRPWLRRSALTPIVSHPPSCAPFPPGPLRPLVALMGALTPARSVAPVLGLSPAASRSAPREQVSLIHALGLRTLLSPTTGARSASSGQGTLSPPQVGPSLLPHGSSPNRNSGLRHYLAGSPHHPGPIEFVNLRTGRSPLVAPHYASRRDLALRRDRSYVRLQVYVDLVRTLRVKHQPIPFVEDYFYRNRNY